MPRKPRFRAWHTKQKIMYSPEEMAKDQLTLLPTGEFINVHGSDTRLSSIDYDQIMIPLESTGLHDKDGKEIFEGDIVEYLTHEGTERNIVEWSDDLSAFILMPTDKNIKIACLFHSVGNDAVEVIGNQYEHPLEGE